MHYLTLQTKIKGIWKSSQVEKVKRNRELRLAEVEDMIALLQKRIKEEAKLYEIVKAKYLH